MSRRKKFGTKRLFVRSRRELLENLSRRAQRDQDRQIQAPEPNPEPEESDAKSH